MDVESKLKALEGHKNLVREFVQAINAQDWTRLDDLVAADFIRHSAAGGGQTIKNRDELKAFLKEEIKTFPDAQESIKDLVAEGDKVAARQNFQGTQTGWLGRYEPSGKRMCADYLVIYRVQKGRIAEAWAEWDNLSGLKQLGHFDSPA